MLVGRDPELQELRALVAAARVGESAVLVLTGEAGIGKTSLLEDAASTSAGTRVLRAAGSEADREVPFGALLQVLRPALVHLDRLPPPQAAALASALALQPGSDSGSGDDRFAVGAATLSLLSRYAEDGPVVVLLDDAHLLDLPSAQALVFAARRLTADPVAVLACVREGEPSDFLDAGLPVRRLSGLSLDATTALLAQGGRHPGAAAVARLHEATGGNPLAVVELSDEAGNLEPAPFGAPLRAPASLTRAFARRLERLSAPARTATLAAAGGTGRLDVLSPACAALGVDVATLGEAEDAGLLHVDDGVVLFRHPLVRSAVWSGALPSARRAVHRALAAALPDDEADRRTWHLSEASLGPDEQLARSLDAVATRATRRRAHAVAAAVLARAAGLSPRPADRASRLVAAGEAAWQAGADDHAQALLAKACDPVLPPALHVRVTALRGRIAARTGSVALGRDLLLAAAQESAGHDPDAAVLLLADAVLACFFLADTAALAQASDLLRELLPRAGRREAGLVGAMAAGAADVLTGRGGPDRMRAAVAELDPDDPLIEDPRVGPWLVLGPLFLRERGSGRDLVPVVVDGMRRRAAIGELPLLLFFLARDQATTDRWDLAPATYAEGVLLAREAGRAAELAMCLAGLSWLEARTGREQACRQHAAEALALSDPGGIALSACWALSALGELELGLGHPERALEHLQALQRRLDALDVADVDLSPGPELAEALAHLGRDDEARAAAARYAEQSRRKGQPWALARAARACAATCGDDELDHHVQRALGHHAEGVDAFECARTQLVHGARLRRARRRVEARPPLRSALAAFEALGAAPWADQAAAELLATGETARRRDASALDALTPQEAQVARLLAGGRTTREAAAALFLSPKTVEYHLRHVYLKLDIATRAELVVALQQNERTV